MISFPLSNIGAAYMARPGDIIGYREKNRPKFPVQYAMFVAELPSTTEGQARMKVVPYKRRDLIITDTKTIDFFDIEGIFCRLDTVIERLVNQRTVLKSTTLIRKLGFDEQREGEILLQLIRAYPMAYSKHMPRD